METVTNQQVAQAVADATKPGVQTSEFKLVQLMHYVGIVLTLMGSIVAMLPSSVLSANHYVALGVAVLGAVIKIAATLGYAQQRANIKVAVLEAAQAFAPKIAPAVKELEEVIPDSVIPQPAPAKADPSQPSPQ